MRKIFILTFSYLLFFNNIYSQNEKIKVKPSGRILMDMGIFRPLDQRDLFNNGIAITDLRIGLKTSYNTWKAKMEVGYALNKLSIKDVFIQNSINKSNLFQAGYFIHHFGLQNATGSSNKVSMEEPMSSQAVFNSRLLGLMYVHSNDKFFGTLSVFSEDDAIKMSTDKLGNEGYGIITRLVFRPIYEQGKIFHLGISGGLESPHYNKTDSLNHNSYTLKTKFPTRIAKITAQEAIVTNADMLYKFTPELTLAINKIALEAQYFYLQINRSKNLKNYKTHGGYALLRGIIKGESYSYSKSTSCIPNAKPGSMELTLGYNFTNLSDNNANIHGGNSNDFSFTFSYYINKYVLWRIRASHTIVEDRFNFENNDVSLLETRLQIKF